MHVGVIVGSLQSREADQGAGVAGDRVGNLLDQRRAILGTDRVAHACFPEHGHHGLLGFSANLGRASRLLLHRDALLCGGPFCFGGFLQFAFDFGFARFTRHAFAGVEALGDVDPDFADAAGAYGVEVLLVLEYEFCPPERVLHPRAAKLMQVHAEGEVVDADLLEHGGIMRCLGKLEKTKGAEAPFVSTP